MDKKKAALNISSSIIFRVIILILSLIVRSLLVNKIGVESSGLLSLYNSIFGFLSIAELGIGTAIAFSMYKPIVNKEYDIISGLYYLYKKIYLIIFFIIILIGLSITPIIPILAKGSSENKLIYITYFIFIVATAMSYVYAYKTTFINAYSDNYLTTIIRSTGLIIESLLQITFIILIPDKYSKIIFILFFLSILLSNIIQWIITHIIFKIKYSKFINKNKNLSSDLKNDVWKKTRAMFYHKIGGLLVSTTDNIIISFFIGILILGMYSNYILLGTGLISIISLIFSSISSIIGHSFAKNNKNVYYNQFKMIYTLNFILGFIFLLGFYSVVDIAIEIFFSKDLIIDKSIVILITLNFFIQFMRNTIIGFRDASGTFYEDRFKPIIEGVLNLVLSLILVIFLGISGVLIATIITNLLVTYTVEPYILYKHVFNKKPVKYYILNYLIVVIFFISLLMFENIPFSKRDDLFLQIIIRGGTSLILSSTLIMVIMIINKEIRWSIINLFREAKKIIKNKKE